MSKEKLRFDKWLIEKNIVFIILGAIVLYVLERFAKNLHNDLIVPSCGKLLRTMGISDRQDRPTHQKILLHVIELFITILLLYFLSQYIFNHGSLNANNLPVTTEKKDQPPIIIFM